MDERRISANRPDEGYMWDHTRSSGMYLLPENRHRSGGNFKILLLLWCWKKIQEENRSFPLSLIFSLFLRFIPLFDFPDQETTIAVASFSFFPSSVTGIVWNAFQALLTKIKSAILFPGSKDTCFTISFSQVSLYYRRESSCRSLTHSVPGIKNVKV